MGALKATLRTQSCVVDGGEEQAHEAGNPALCGSNEKARPGKEAQLCSKPVPVKGDASWLEITRYTGLEGARTLSNNVRRRVRPTWWHQQRAGFPDAGTEQQPQVQPCAMRMNHPGKDNGLGRSMVPTRVKPSGEETKKAHRSQNKATGPVKVAEQEDNRTLPAKVQEAAWRPVCMALLSEMAAGASVVTRRAPRSLPHRTLPCPRSNPFNLTNLMFMTALGGRYLYRHAHFPGRKRTKPRLRWREERCLAAQGRGRIRTPAGKCPSCVPHNRVSLRLGRSRLKRSCALGTTQTTEPDMSTKSQS